MSLGGGPAHAGAASVSAAGDDDDSTYRYCMDHGRRGRFIIINNKTFKPETEMKERTGTDLDAENLSADFKQLGFGEEEVTVHDNQTAYEMLQLMIEGNHYVHLTSYISRVCVDDLYVYYMKCCGYSQLHICACFSHAVNPLYFKPVTLLLFGRPCVQELSSSCQLRWATLATINMG